MSYLTDEEIDLVCAGCSYSCRQYPNSILEGPSDCEECNTCSAMIEMERGKAEWEKEHGIL